MTNHPVSLSTKLALAALMLALASNRLVNVLADDGVVWVLHDLTLSACAAFAAILSAQLIPYSSLRLKCAASVVAGAASVDFVCVAFQASGYWYWLALQVIVGFSASWLYLFRSYHQESDEIDEDHLYCLRAIPRTGQDFLIAMFGVYGSYGGYALYARGTIYRYKKGVLVAQKCNAIPKHKYHVSRGAIMTDELTINLQDLVGSKWSLIRNCITVFGPIWRGNSGRAA